MSMTEDERKAEIARLEAKLASSQRMAGQGGYKERIEAIETALKDLRKDG